MSWGDWFRTFDDRNLVFLFQEEKRDGTQSNFFRFDNPSGKTPDRRFAAPPSGGARAGAGVSLLRAP